MHPIEIDRGLLPLAVPDNGHSHANADPYRGLDHQSPFNRELLHRLNAIPGVELAAITASLPTAPYNAGDVLNTALTIEDRPRGPRKICAPKASA